MGLNNIIMQIEGEILAHKDGIKNCAPTHYAIHAMAIETLEHYLTLLKQELNIQEKAKNDA